MSVFFPTACLNFFPIIFFSPSLKKEKKEEKKFEEEKHANEKNLSVFQISPKQATSNQDPSPAIYYFGERFTPRHLSNVL